MLKGRCWYIDASVTLRYLKEGSVSTKRWFLETLENGDHLISSKFSQVEVLRTLKAAGLDLTIAFDHFKDYMFMDVDNALVDEAILLEPRLRAADALHIASANRLGPDVIHIVTHDAQMASAARELGFTVKDPVSDD
jgi:predicted nucleic acid-binding protein